MDKTITDASLALPSAFMTEQWMGSHVFKVGDTTTFKMFAVLLPGKNRLTVKTPDPDIADMLIASGVASKNAHLPRGGWVQLHTDVLDPEDTRERIAESHALAVASLSKAARKKFDLG